MTVGKVIRKCRKIRKMSLTELGKAAGFTKGADVRISQYQADRAVPTTAIKKCDDSHLNTPAPQS